MRPDSSRAHEGIDLFKKIFLSVLLVALLGGGIGILRLFSSLPVVEGVKVIDGVKADVEIIRDPHGVPHIKGQSEEDAYFALGYVHAQDRLWQMEAMRRVGGGRLSEVVGERALNSDRFMRMLGINRLVEAQYKILDEPVRRALDAYSAGVNAWMESHSGALPPEFLALLYRPEPWRPSDSLMWGKMMAIKLSGNWSDELLRARLSARLTPEKIAELWPPYPTTGPIAGNAVAGLFEGLPLQALAAAMPEPAGLPRGASNSWVVSGKLTASGKPLLANDPHLNFGAPVLWYLADIKAPGLHVTGATVPGVPFIVIGHNQSIAWGMTSTQSDLEDLFVEQVAAGDPSRYDAPDGPLPFTTRNEVIRVRKAEDVTLTVRETRHGPVLSDILGKRNPLGDEGRMLALAATYLRDDDVTPQSLYYLNRAQGWDAFTAALKSMGSPQLNVNYADINGNIGFLAPGRVPIRRSGRGHLPQPGWTGEADWTGFVPYAELPMTVNPPQGRIVTANNKIVGDDYPYLITDFWEPPYRAQRILDLIDGAGPHTMDSMAAIQADAMSMMAKDLLPRMLGMVTAGEKTRQVSAMLSAWNGVMSRDRPEPLIFNSWLREFNRAVYADELGEMFDGYWTLRPAFIATVLEQKGEWCDNADTPAVEDCKTLLEQTLERVVDDLSGRFGDAPQDWRWGDVHIARFRHPLFSGRLLIGEISDLSIASDGGDFTVNRGATLVSNPEAPFDHIHGAGLRAVYDLSNLSNSRFMIATGQSGNPLSGHYRDLVEDWRDGRYMTRFGQPENTLILKPR